MTVAPLAGFRHFPTHHCVTGAMRHVYVYNDHDLSEEMLLGLGAGVSFAYWHFKGQPPFLGGRGGFRPPLEEAAGRRTGVVVERHTTSGARKARQALLDLLATVQPVMIYVDMGFLPYFDFGEEYHFGGHAVVVCGYDAEADEALIADRDGAPHPVPMAALERARGSTFKPFPPQNLWFTFDFAGKRPPAAAEVRQAIAEMVQAMVEPPIRNLGAAGIRKAAGEVVRWPELLAPDELRATLFNVYIFINAAGGTGGGCFRYMLSRFLGEAAEICAEPGLAASAGRFREIGDHWEELGEQLRSASAADEPAAALGEAAARLRALADREEAAWRETRS